MDAKKFYESASSQVDNTHLQSVFINAAEVHAAIINDLETLFISSENDLEAKGSLKGSANRIIGRLKAYVNHTDQTLVAELEKSESNTIGQFEDALTKRLDQHILRVLGKHLMQLKNNYDHLRNLAYYLESANETE